MSRREFPAKVRALAFRRSGGHCQKCTRKLSVSDVHFDHVIPDQLGGEPVLENCEVLCRSCHAVKTYREDVPNIARAKRREARHFGFKTPSRAVIPGSKRSQWKRHINGTISRRNP